MRDPNLGSRKYAKVDKLKLINMVNNTSMIKDEAVA